MQAWELAKTIEARVPSERIRMALLDCLSLAGIKRGMDGDQLTVIAERDLGSAVSRKLRP